ncbi:site-specific integrase [Rhodococcus jostii]|uniref:site-specific integrase n=1 Tax=Rhodococcus jostii TaxID=132919 RepID=UPI0019676CA9
MVGPPSSRIRRYLTDFVAQGNSQASVRSYAYALLRWWRWLRAVDVDWDKATPAECRDLVLWLQANLRTRRSPRTKSLATAGTINPITRKRYLDDNYAIRTIRHSKRSGQGLLRVLDRDRPRPPDQSGAPQGAAGLTPITIGSSNSARKDGSATANRIRDRQVPAFTVRHLGHGRSRERPLQVFAGAGEFGVLDHPVELPCRVTLLCAVFVRVGGTVAGGALTRA